MQAMHELRHAAAGLVAGAALALAASAVLAVVLGLVEGTAYAGVAALLWGTARRVRPRRRLSSRAALRVDHTQSGDAPKVAVTGHEPEAVRKCGRGDPQVVRTRNLAPPLQRRPDVGMDTGDRFGYRHRFKSREQVLDESAPSRSRRATRPRDAVQQFARGHHADSPLVVADERVESGGIARTFPVDQEVRVDQDGQGAPSGSPTDRRRARMSSTKVSSTGGADARSSRNRSAESRRARGGAMTATWAPARVTSISSPAATRFSTSENFRATSVALIRVIGTQPIG